MDHQLCDDPFASSISSLEAEMVFSGGQMPSLPWPDLDLDDDDIHDLSAPAANATSSGGYGSGGSGSNRKLSHNAYERDRRKQLNELYSSLRSLLPDADHTKLSIPTTVSRVLKYIPELQKQVANLERRKKELTSANCKPGVLNTSASITPIVSATCFNDMEIMVQVSLLSNVAATTLPPSKCIKVLENEGLHLISSSTYSTFENRTFYSLHFQRSRTTMKKECPAFCHELERVVMKTAAQGGKGNYTYRMLTFGDNTNGYLRQELTMEVQQ
ncbi:protein IRON-RELATED TRANSCRIPTION FACTOR 2-like isoform X2 [Phragmites australis]|uniref:protein IRON-RELATED TRANSCRIPTION FACTOR 2-like isoform X2 n=1 Tax=Phragmites australis TaxID=29695 RepID=UPI002D76685F|nr:protein IRON-RELATED TRANSCRIPTION FACTOR 2-like isoform X2 [Phragmites australis]